MVSPDPLAVPATRHDLFSHVRLRKSVTSHDAIFAAGTSGTIVDVHGLHQAYEVEFTEPHFRVITLTGDILQRG